MREGRTWLGPRWGRSDVVFSEKSARAVSGAKSRQGKKNRHGDKGATGVNPVAAATGQGTGTSSSEPPETVFKSNVRLMAPRPLIRKPSVIVKNVVLCNAPNS